MVTNTIITLIQMVSQIIINYIKEKNSDKRHQEMLALEREKIQAENKKKAE